MKVELLWWDGCPSYSATFEDLKRVLAEEGVEAEVDLVEVETDDQARAERFPGPGLPARRWTRLADARPRGHPPSRQEGAMKIADGGWPHPYLRDESQEVARAYDAQTTPDVSCSARTAG